MVVSRRGRPVKTLLSWTITIGLITTAAWWLNPALFASFNLAKNDSDKIMAAWEKRQSNILVEAEGQVVLELPDLEDIKTVQRFMVSLENGHRVMIVHDLDVAPRVPVSVFSEIRFKGEFDWTQAGGMIHWTHRDISGKREGGWIEVLGQRYQ